MNDEQMQGVSYGNFRFSDYIRVNTIFSTTKNINKIRNLCNFIAQKIITNILHDKVKNLLFILFCGLKIFLAVLFALNFLAFFSFFVCFVLIFF